MARIPVPPPPVGGTSFYVDGVPDGITFTGGTWSWDSNQELELGLSHDSSHYQPYNGQLDDVRFYNRALTSAEIASAHTGALVDNNALALLLNFTTAPTGGITLTWQLPGAILQSADSVGGPYADVTGGVSPYTVSVQKAAKYYRYSGVHAPAVVISNPYFM